MDEACLGFLTYFLFFNASDTSDPSRIVSVDLGVCFLFKGGRDLATQEVVAEINICEGSAGSMGVLGAASGGEDKESFFRLETTSVVLPSSSSSSPFSQGISTSPRFWLVSEINTN